MKRKEEAAVEPLISVVMPTYNSEKYVAEAVESILTQTLPDFEFLIVNEYGSNDATVDIINAFHDPRVRIIQSTERLGIAASLNEGIRQAKGKYIARMDSDDISVPERFEKQIAFMEEHPEIAVLGGWQRHFGAVSVIHKTPCSHEEIRAALLFNCEMCHSVIMLRREEMLKHDLWYDPAFVSEDYELWLRAAEKVRFANIPEVLGYYRFEETNNTSIKKTCIVEQEQELYARTLKRLDIDYKNVYPAYLACGWYSGMRFVPRERWKEHIDMLRQFSAAIVRQNEKLGVYDNGALSRCLIRHFMYEFDTGESFYEIPPFEYLADDIIDELEAKAGERLSIFGLGKIGSRMLPHFKRRFGGRLVCVSDNDPSKWGQIFEGLECAPPNELPRDLCVIITVGYERFVEIGAALAEKGFARVLPYVSLFSEPI